MLSLTQDSFKINLIFLHIFGMYSPAIQTLSYKLRGILFHLLCVSPFPVLSLLHLSLNNKDLKLEDLNYDAPFYIQVCCYFLKLTIFIINGGRIRRCIEYMDSYKFSLITAKQKAILKEASRICQRNTVAFLGFCMAGVAGYAIKPLFEKERRLPSIIWLPLSVKTKLSTFYFVYLTMTIIMAIISFGTGVIDPLMAGLTHHATCHIKILNDHLKNLDMYVVAEKNLTQINVTKRARVYRRIVELVKYYAYILKFVQEIESCFSWVFFSQIVGSVFLLCFVCLQVAKVKTFDYTVFQLLSYFVVIIGQVTFYCYYGNNLTKENDDITKSIYMSKWYNYDLRCRKSLIIFMQRSQKPLVITGGKILDLSLVTLAMIVRRSYSLLAVLQNY